MKYFSLKIKISGVFLAFSFGAFAQNNFWKRTPETSLNSLSVAQNHLKKPAAFKSFALDTASLKTHLRRAPKTLSEAAKKSPVTMFLPMPDGTYGNFAITETSVMEPELAAQYPEIRTYNGQGIDDPTTTVKLNWTYNGFYATVHSPTQGTIIVSPLAAGSKAAYIAYNLKDLSIMPSTEKKMPNVLANVGGPQSGATSGIVAQARAATAQGTTAAVQGATGGICLGTQLLTYRIEVSCTGEYAQALGYQLGYGAAITKAQVVSDMVNKVSSINDIFERDVSISLVLVANEANVIFLDGTTDPYSDNTNVGTIANENVGVANTYIGIANYDCGIALTNTGSGVANSPAVCSSVKAGGCSGYGDPTNPYYILSISHEIGHEFGAPHSFVDAACGATTPGAGVEPGSGATVMSYAGGCDAVSTGIRYFHTSSRGSIYTYTRTGAGSACAVVTATGNHVPVVSVAGTAYSIPQSTPFTMTGSATDADGDALTYMWEEFDAGTVSTAWNQPQTTSPLFVDFAPTTSPSRTFPQISDILSGVSTPGEFLANYARDINLRLTVRDNRSGGGGVCSADAVVTVTSSAPFIVTSQASGTSWIANGTNTQTIAWNVASTNTSPINCAKVDILFSIDGGYTYPYALASGVANNGSASIVVPSYNTPLGRVMVRSVGNVFFNVNTSNISVQVAGCSAEGASLTNNTAVSAVTGSARLNLNIAPQYISGALFTNVGGTFSLSDPLTPNTVQDASGGSVCFGNTYHYKSWYITPGTTGSYTFTRTGNANVLNLYSTPFDSSNTCSSLIQSSYLYDATHNGQVPSITATLSKGTVYVLVSSWHDQGDPSFTNSLTAQPAGSSLYLATSPYADPGTAYGYKYVMVNNATNNIVDIASTADLSSSAKYPTGNYTVYGLSYSNAIAGSLGSYTGGAFTALTNQMAANPGSFCANLSKNSVPVQITASGNNPGGNSGDKSFGQNYTATPMGVYTTIYAGAITIGSGGSLRVSNGGNWVLAGNITSAHKGGSNAPTATGRTETVTFDGSGTYNSASTTAGVAGFIVDGYAASTATWIGNVLPIGDPSAAFPITVPAGTAVTAAYFAGNGTTQATAVNGVSTTEYSPYVDFPKGIPAGSYTISYPAGFSSTNSSALLSSGNTSANGTNSSTAYSLLKKVSAFAGTASTTVATLPATAITQLYFSSSASTSSTSTMVVPVAMVSFTGKSTGCTANLAWQITSEINSSYYAVEVGPDWVNFNQVAKFVSKNSLSGSSYSYDYPLGKGTVYLRLKAVDNEGKYTYSSVVAITGSADCNASTQVVVSPNPAKDVLNITGLLTGSHVGLYDMGGQKLTEVIATGNKQAIQISSYANGMYLLHIQAADGTIKFIKVVKE